MHFVALPSTIPMTSRLRVGVDARLSQLGTTTGVGGVWHHLLSGLRDHVEIVPDRRGRSARPFAFRAPSVRLIEGHAAPTLRPADAPQVCLVHDVRWADEAQRSALPLSTLAVVAPATEGAVRASVITVVPSEFVASTVRELYQLDADHVRVIPWGVGHHITPVTGFDNEMRRSEKLERLLPSLPYILFIGTVEPRKNIPELRAAMRLLAERGTRAQLVVRLSPAPGQDSRALLREAAAALDIGDPELDHVVVLPPLSSTEISFAIAKASVVCLPSTYEGFGLPALEAMAAGVPVVVANRTALPEVVGNGAMVVEPHADAIADALGSILGSSELAKSLADRGRQRSQDFTWGHATTKLLAVLEEAVTRPPVRGTKHEPAKWLATKHINRCPVCHAPTPHSAGDTDPQPCRSCHAVHAVTIAGDIPAGPQGRTRAPGWPSYLINPDTFETYQRCFAEHVLTEIAQHISPPGRLLDLQPDTRILLDIAVQRGWMVTDVQPSSKSCDAAVGAFWIDLAESAPESLAAAAANVRPGGLIVIATPNWRSPARRFDGSQWHHLRPLESITYFDRSSLRAALRSAGLEIVSMASTTVLTPDLEIAAHTLVPWRRFLLGDTLDSGSVRARRSATRGLARMYDLVGRGDTLVALARVLDVTPT